MGHFNNLLLRMVAGERGDEAVARVFDRAGIEARDYQPEVIYPEAEFQALYRAFRVEFELDDIAAQEAFATFFIEISPKMFPAIFEVAGNARGLLERVPLIHKQWPSAASASEFRDKVILARTETDRIVYRYDSPNRLCRVLTRATELVLELFDEQGEVRELQCARRGAPHCEVEIRFAPDAKSSNASSPGGDS